MLKEEPMEIKKCLDPEEFQNFTASNGWLEKWKLSYDIRKSKVNGGTDEVPEYTVSAWMERILELTGDYEPAVVFSRHCLKKVQLKKRVMQEGIKNLKLD